MSKTVTVTLSREDWEKVKAVIPPVYVLNETMRQAVDSFLTAHRQAMKPKGLPAIAEEVEDPDS